MTMRTIKWIAGAFGVAVPASTSIALAAKPKRLRPHLCAYAAVSAWWRVSPGASAWFAESTIWAVRSN